jgi:hypothetical protein
MLQRCHTLGQGSLLGLSKTIAWTNAACCSVFDFQRVGPSALLLLSDSLHLL